MGMKDQEAKIFESEHVSASWSRDTKVYVEVIDEDGEYFIYGKVEDETVFGTERIEGIGDLNEWLSMAPTARKALDLEEAIRIAKEMIENRESWMSEKYN
jgi:hypothetical protein